MNSYICHKCKKNGRGGGSLTWFWREHGQKITLNLKKSGLIREYDTVSVGPKILLFEVKFSLPNIV